MKNIISRIKKGNKNQLLEIKEPSQCHLWRMIKLSLSPYFLNDLEVVKYLEEPSSPGADAVTRSILKCKKCGQLYFKETLEWRDMIGGNDSDNIQIIPIEEKNIKNINKLSAFDLLGCSPRISYSSGVGWHWVRKSAEAVESENNNYKLK